MSDSLTEASLEEAVKQLKAMSDSRIKIGVHPTKLMMFKYPNETAQEFAERVVKARGVATLARIEAAKGQK